MRLVALFSFLISASLSHAAVPKAVSPASPLTVLLDFEQPHSSISFDSLQQELQRLFAPARLKIDLRIHSELPSAPQFTDVLLFKMKGHCTMDALPIGALSDERGALAMTYSVDGDLLPFGEVECDRVRQSIQRTLGKGDPERHQATFGIALGRVIAHEVYHMITNSSAHTKDGLTKESLSGRELSQQLLSYPAGARTTLQDRANHAFSH